MSFSQSTPIDGYRQYALWGIDARISLSTACGELSTKEPVEQHHRHPQLRTLHMEPPFRPTLINEQHIAHPRGTKTRRVTSRHAFHGIFFQPTIKKADTAHRHRKRERKRNQYSIPLVEDLGDRSSKVPSLLCYCICYYSTVNECNQEEKHNTPHI